MFQLVYEFSEGSMYMVGIKENAHAYQPINSYGVIGDCHSAVLVAPDG